MFDIMLVIKAILAVVLITLIAVLPPMVLSLICGRIGGALVLVTFPLTVWLCAIIILDWKW